MMCVHFYSLSTSLCIIVTSFSVIFFPLGLVFFYSDVTNLFFLFLTSPSSVFFKTTSGWGVSLTGILFVMKGNTRGQISRTPSRTLEIPPVPLLKPSLSKSRSENKKNRYEHQTSVEFRDSSAIILIILLVWHFLSSVLPTLIPTFTIHLHESWFFEIFYRFSVWFFSCTHVFRRSTAKVEIHDIDRPLWYPSHHIYWFIIVDKQRGWGNT